MLKWFSFQRPYKLSYRLVHSSLEDTFGRKHSYLRISLTERCNLRCTYCMPLHGVQLTPKTHLLTNEEIFTLSRIFVSLGVKKLRLTGGEPTIRRDLPDIISTLKSIPDLEHVSITTNGLLLTRCLPKYLQSGLDAVNISLDTLKETRFEAISRRPSVGLRKVLAGIDLALQLNMKTVKVNCVVMRGVNDDELLDFVELTKDRNIDVRFIEYMPFDGNKWSDRHLVSSKELLDNIKTVYADISMIEPKPNDTSKCYKINTFKGQIGFISSMTNHFCGTCNRIRLTADGNLKVCLFGNSEVSLRDALRNGLSNREIIDLISSAVKRKKKQHAGLTLSDYSKTFSHSHLFFFTEYKTVRVRNFSTLSHSDGMVDVANKLETDRTARAIAEIQVGANICKLINDSKFAKGDVLAISELAGIQAAKRTWEFIPLCHNIALSHVQVRATLQVDKVFIETKVRCYGRTGVEMEALTAACVAALTVYDMCKSASHDITITKVQLVEKFGGKSGHYLRTN